MTNFMTSHQVKKFSKEEFFSLLSGWFSTQATNFAKDTWTWISKHAFYMYGYAVDNARVEIQTFCSEKLYLQPRSFSHNLLPQGDSHPPFRKTSNEDFFFAKQPCVESCLPLEKASLSSCAPRPSKSPVHGRSTQYWQNWHFWTVCVLNQFATYWTECRSTCVLQWSFQRLGCQGFNRWK